MAGNQDTQLDDILGAIQASKNSQATHAPPPERPRDPRLFDRFWNSLGTQWTGLNDEGEPVPMLETKQEEPVWDPFDPNATQKIVQGHEPVLSLGTRTLPEQLKSTFNGDLLDENASPALQRLNEIESKTRAKAGLDAPQGLAENLAENAGMLVGQLPLPGDMLSSAVQKLPTAARYALAAPAAVADFFGPTFHPSAKNLASGATAGVGIQKAMDAWLEHQQAKKDAKWGPLEDSMDRYHQDLIHRAREGKITDKEAEYLLDLLNTSGSGSDILDEPDPNEVPPVKYAKGGKVRKAKGGKIKPPTMTKLGLRQRLQELMSDANVQGTGKELTPFVPSEEDKVQSFVDSLNPVTPGTRSALEDRLLQPDSPLDIQIKEEQARNNEGPVLSRRDVLKGMASLANPLPIKLDPISMMSEALPDDGVSLSSGIPHPEPKAPVLGVIARMNDREGFEQNAWGATAAEAWRQLANKLYKDTGEPTPTFNEHDIMDSVVGGLDEHGVDYERGYEADVRSNHDDPRENVMSWLRGHVRGYDGAPTKQHLADWLRKRTDEDIGSMTNGNFMLDEIHNWSKDNGMSFRDALHEFADQLEKEHKNELLYDPEDLETTDKVRKLHSEIKASPDYEDRLEYGPSDLLKAHPDLSPAEAIELHTLLQYGD